MKEFYLVIIASVAMTITALSTEIPTTCPLKDPVNKTIHIAHKSDCTKFYKCLMGDKHEMTCPEYKEGKRLCFNPKTQICDWPWNVPCCKKTELPVDPHCPSLDNHTTAVWPHPTSCNLYFTCKDGIKSLRFCDKGHLFDSESLRCRPSGNVKCKKDIVCPPAGSSEIVIVPHECNCMKYYECVSGEVVRKHCPANMKFDYIRRECVPAEEAVCNTDSGTVSPKPTPTVAPVTCPPDGIKDLPHETDCSSYYRCENGTRHLEHCTDGFYFDEIMSMCTWWENVDCGLRSSDKNATDEVPLTECPPKGSHENVTLPHECACDKYYLCKDKQAVLQRCEKGTVYDYVKQVCGDPNTVKCERPIPQPNTAPTNTPTDPVTTVSLLTVSVKFTCPSTGIKRYPIASNCRKYYECKNGYGQEQDCLEGHYFNPKVEQCDIMQGGECGMPSPTTPTTTTNTTPESNNECNDNSYCKGIIRFPNKNDNDCLTYYECVNGKKERKTCREGLKYNEASQMCDLPEYVRCGHRIPIKCTSDSPDGQRVPHDCQCNLYYECQKGMAVRQECNKGLSYDWKIQGCVQADQATCYTNF